MNVPPVSVERVQKCVVNFEIYRFLKKAANLPHPPLLPIVIQSITFHAAAARLYGRHPTPYIEPYLVR